MDAPIVSVRLQTTLIRLSPNSYPIEVSGTLPVHEACRRISELSRHAHHHRGVPKIGCDGGRAYQDQGGQHRELHCRNSASTSHRIVTRWGCRPIPDKHPGVKPLGEQSMLQCEIQSIATSWRACGPRRTQRHPLRGPRGAPSAIDPSCASSRKIVAGSTRSFALPIRRSL